jgi:shikimate dehydrogenase
MADPSKTFCVIGDPIGHSLSPAIHRFVFDRLDVSYDYEAVRVTADELEAFVKSCRDENRPGFNVTIPHKENVIRVLDEIDPKAQTVGAVNTVINRSGRLTGYNTDVTGFREALVKADWKPGNTVLLGAGGAARAVLSALNSLGVNEATLFDVDEARAKSLSRDPVRSDMNVTTIENMESIRPKLTEAVLLVNATPVGMWPKTDASPVPDPEWIPQGMLVFDLVPNPLRTRLLAEAEARGCRTIPGLVMLVGQALAADTLWLNRPMPDGLDKDVLSYLVKRMESHG